MGILNDPDFILLKFKEDCARFGIDWHAPNAADLLDAKLKEEHQAQVESQASGQKDQSGS